MADIQFQAFTIKFSGRAREIVSAVNVAPPFPPGRAPAGILNQTVNALWDTGASASVISASLAQKLNLVPVGVAAIHHAGGTSQVPRYLVNLLLPNQVGRAGLLVSEFPDPAHGRFQFIVGMDVITEGDFSITNAGATWTSFRMPSRSHIDYVQQHDQAMHQQVFGGVGRNDPCPCGSGQKFKKCHGK